MNIGIIGGDKRMGLLAELAAKDGEQVLCSGLERYPFFEPCLSCNHLETVIRAADILLLPLPVIKEPGFLFAPLADRELPFEEVLSLLSPRQRVLGGAVSPAVFAAFDAAGLEVTDYFASEEVAIENAVATVEGAIETVMRETDVTVAGSRVLILGYGRLGKVAADLFAKLGAEVAVAARKKADLAWIAVRGATPVPFAERIQHLNRFDTVINTVPAPVLGENELRHLCRNALAVDLATKPGGIDFDAAERLGIRALPAWNLPGKVAPRTAAAILYRAVQGLIEE